MTDMAPEELVLDHLAVSGGTLEAARAHVEEALGVAMQAGGRHDVFFTHNALLGLEENLYLEAIAIDPDAAAPERPRWFDLDRFTGPARLTNWVCRCTDLEATLAGLPGGMGHPVDLRRDALRWRMAVPADGRLPFDNRAPALISWQAGGHPCDVLTRAPVRLRRLTIRHPQADQLSAALAKHFGDDRVAFETGAPGLHAEFATPHGLRELSG